MEDIVIRIGQFCAAAGAVCALFYKITLEPLNGKFNNVIEFMTEKVEALGASVDKFDTSIDRIDDKLSGFDVRLARVEESTKSAHHRIDGLEKDIKAGR